MRRRAYQLAAALLISMAAVVSAAPFVGRFRRSWAWRVTVEGHSMEPTLRAGDWLLVDPLAYRIHRPRAGELVVAADPRLPSRWLIKRVAAATGDGKLVLVGDHPRHAIDGGGDPLRVEPAALLGRPWLRYWPLSRFGRLRSLG
ncbi:MAG: S26 family signal peptidase [Chloroflexota bacterium]|nr:S26 family signal peptidase [Chloroflexota bacterium]